jgi:hypothetical protein
VNGIFHGQHWTSFLDIRRRLNVVVEVVDDRLVPVLPALGGGAASVARRRLLTADADAVGRTVRHSLANLTQEVVRGDRVRLTSTPIVVAGRAVGALIVAGEGYTEEAGLDEGADLERLGSWLAAAVAAQLASPATDEPSDLHRLSSLYRLLDQATASGSEAEVVRTFMEALAVWEDIESRAYVGDLMGHFFLAVSLPGSDPAEAPVGLSHDPVPAGTRMVHLSAVDRTSYGFPERSDVTIARLRGGATTEWLIAASATGNSDRLARLSVYLHVLTQALNSVTAIELSRLTWETTQRLILGDSPQRAVETAIDQLSDVLGGTTGFSLFRSDGLEVLTAGDTTGVLGLAAPTKKADLLLLPVYAPFPYTAMIGVRKNDERPFTRRDEKLVEAAASTLSAWLVPTVRRLSALRERRGAYKTFDQMLEHYGRDTASDDDISMVLVALGERATPPQVGRGLIDEIRRRLRPTDLAGRLVSGDIGVLLLHTASDGAEIVARRLQQLISADAQFKLLANATIGVATRARGSASTDSLLKQAQGRATAATDNRREAGTE